MTSNYLVINYLGFPDPLLLDELFQEVLAERCRQDEKFGWILQTKEYGGKSILPSDDVHAKNTVLGEEVGEVAKAILEGDPIEHLHEELIQVAAVCLAWVQADRQKAAAADLG